MGVDGQNIRLAGEYGIVRRIRIHYFENISPISAWVDLSDGNIGLFPAGKTDYHKGA